jgi:hypothetical protein
MAKKIVTFDRFFGGISDSEKLGTEGSFSFARSIDIRKEPTKFELLPKTAKESGTTVVDLIKWFEPVGTDMYSYGDGGKIYKRTSGASWSVLRTVSNSSGNGLGYFPEDDYLYYSLDKVIGRYGPIGGTPAFTDDVFTDGTYDLDQTQTASGNTYTLLTAVSEAAANKLSFIPDRDPQLKMQINIDTKGTGDWTVAVHDAADVEVATDTIVNASVSTGDQTFTFTTWRPVIGATYHFHVTSTVADGKVTTANSADLETADFSTFYQVLVNDGDFHPIARHLNLLCIGNERYVATHDGIPGGGNTNYHANKLTLPSGWKVRDLDSTGEYLAIVAWKGSTITDFEESMIFFWDGIASTYNFFIPVKEGVATSGVSEEGRFYYMTTRGNLYMWNGQVTKLQQIPNMTQQTYAEVFPDAMKMWQGLIRIGVGGSTDSSTVEQGVYTWGTKTITFPESLTYDYPISTGTRTATTLKISALGVRANTLFIAWDDNGTYGVDVVTTTAAPFANGVLETLILDDGVPWKSKQALTLTARHTALASGESIQLGYDVDRSGSFTTGTANSTSSSTETRLDINTRWNEIKHEVIPAATGSTTPKILSLSFAYDDRVEEEIP